MSQNRRFWDHELVVIGRHSAHKATRRVVSCERCKSVNSLQPFTSVLNSVVDERTADRNYILDQPAECPNCGSEIIETTLVDSGNAVCARPLPPNAHPVVVDEAQVLEAQAFVIGCECCAEGASISFDYLLDAVMGCNSCVEYILSRSARCPRCSRAVTEKTRVVAR